MPSFSLRNYKIIKDLEFFASSHYTVQRIIISFIAFFVAGALIFVGATQAASTAFAEKLAARTILSTTFVSSLSGIKGNVESLVLSEDKTRAVVILGFAEGTDISTTADDYEIYAAGTNQELSADSRDRRSIASRGIDIHYITFNSTKWSQEKEKIYHALVIDSNEEFPSDIIDVWVRNKNQIKTDVTIDGDKVSDTLPNSFRKNDQWRVIINPGAKNPTVSSNISGHGTEINPEDIYYNLISSKVEQEYRTELFTQLEKMDKAYKKIEYATTQLNATSIYDAGQRVSLEPVEQPAAISGDVFEGSVKTKDIKYKPKTVFKGGYNFDWVNGNIKDGYLKNIVPAGMSYSEYLSKNNASSESSEAEETEKTMEKIQFKTTAGKPLDDYFSADPVVAPLFDAKNNLTAAWSEYYILKREYQLQYLPKLLVLEVALDNVASNATISHNVHIK